MAKMSVETAVRVAEIVEQADKAFDYDEDAPESPQLLELLGAIAIALFKLEETVFELEETLDASLRTLDTTLNRTLGPLGP